ncbi:MAG: hypothetical protein RBU23_05115 [Candidatus Auribacterota bacterium]|jgi:hypothetical protein|nr:hypothetical protein [Candidatus Auribacterota bacterium]
MARKTYSNKFDTVIEVANKELLSEYLFGKGLALDTKQELSQDYVHELLDKLGTDEERLDITEEVECMEDLASEFFEQTREYILEDSRYNVQWTKDESNETVILRIFLKHTDAYKLIYDLFLCDKFWTKLHHYSLESEQVNFEKDAIEAFKTDLQKYLSEQKKDADCDVRERVYKDRNYVLVLRGDEQRTVTVLQDGKKQHRVFRPAKEDMIVYDKKHAVIGMTPGIGGVKNKLFYANAFNKHILGGDSEIGKEFFASDKYMVNLDPLLTEDFYKRTADIAEIRLVSLFMIKETNPKIELTISSDDVLKSLESMKIPVSVEEILSAKLELKIEGRTVSVRLTQRSTSQLNKTKEREIVEEFLRARKIISF